MGLRTRDSASLEIAPKSLKLRRALERLIPFAPPSRVGSAAWMLSSSQLHTGQISKVPGGLSWSVRNPQQGHPNISASLSVEVTNPAGRFKHRPWNPTCGSYGKGVCRKDYRGQCRRRL